MLGNKNAVANVAVKNLDTAKRFYEGTLGLTPVHTEGEEVIVFRSGDQTQRNPRIDNPKRNSQIVPVVNARCVPPDQTLHHIGETFQSSRITPVGSM